MTTRQLIINLGSEIGGLNTSEITTLIGKSVNNTRKALDSLVNDDYGIDTWGKLCKHDPSDYTDGNRKKHFYWFFQ